MNEELIERLHNEADRDEAEGGFAHELLLEAADVIAAQSKEMEECEPFLKDGETPAQCIARNRNDMEIALSLLAKAKATMESLREALRFYARHEFWMGIAGSEHHKLLIANGDTDGVDGWCVAEKALSVDAAKESKGGKE